MTKSSRNPNSPTAEIPSAMDCLHEIASTRGKRLAVFLDYDGTLTPIVSHPAHAVLSDSMRQAVRTLAARMPVAILSGRDWDDIRRRVDIDGIVYAGSHGFDIAGPRGVRKQIAIEFLPILDAAEKELREKLAGIPGALLERKRFSIAAHYRQVADESVGRFEQAVNDVVAGHPELRRMAGKKVYELQPNIDWNKGRAIIWLLETLGLGQPEVLPLYIGDDLTDEDAFRALEKHGVGIVVTAELRPTAARCALKGPAEVERFLRELVACLPAGDDS
jgi:trehalose-phosphatase